VSAPRRILPGQTYLLTRRLLQRLFMLRPSRLVNRVIAYCLAEAAAHFDIELIAWLVMSNHYHAVVRDPHARLPMFLERFHKMVAKCMNAHYKRWENFWSSEETCVTLLVTPEDVLEKVVYTLTNPVAANLVSRSAEWPGVSSLDHLEGKTTTHERPEVYFSKTSSVMPETVTLAASCPTSRRSDWAKRVREAIAEREQVLRAARVKEKKKVLGRDAVLATRPMDGPRVAEKRRKLRPAIACRNPERYSEACKELRAFRVWYHGALDAFTARKNKERIRLDPALEGAIFPAGTYRMRIWGARCQRFPSPARR
jgi:putative transposase